MNNKEYCPVPRDQIPLNEYSELSKSWFFNIELNNKVKFFREIILSFVITLPIIIIIQSAGNSNPETEINQIILSINLSLIAPIAILSRKLLSWSYIYNRLFRINIEYEETDWHDGQTWEKPLEWRERDLLIANYEVLPIISFLKKILLSVLMIVLMLTSMIALKYKL